MKKSIQMKFIQRSLSRLSSLSPSLTAKFAVRIFSHTRRFKRPDWELELLKNVETFRFKNKLAAYRWGKKTHPIVLLVHGWNGRGTQLGKFIDPLIQAGYQVIAIDGPAHGNSPGKYSNPIDFSKALLQCQRELGGIYAIVAHSFGAGSSVISNCLLHSNQALLVKKLVYIAGPCNYEKVMERFCEHMKLSPKTAQIFKQRINQMVGVAASDLCISKLVKNTSIQGMIVHDTDDSEIPISEAEEIATHWQGSHFLKTSGFGHYKILKEQTVIDKVVRFLT